MTTPLFDSLEIRQFRAFDYIKIDQLGHVNLQATAFVNWIRRLLA